MAKRKNPNEDEPNENDNINESDDSFGLPEIEYEPLNRDTPKEEERYSEETSTEQSEPQYIYEEEQTYKEEAGQDPSAYDYIYEEEESSVWPKVLIVGVIVLLIGAGVGWYFLSYLPQKEREELAKLELARRQEAEQAERERQEALERERLAEEQRIADSIANIQTPQIGTIETLEGRTGLYHVVIASAIDDDLLMDHAQKLSKQGVSTKIIPPFGKWKFYRLAVAEGNSFDETQAKADELKAEYGSNLWVLRY